MVSPLTAWQVLAYELSVCGIEPRYWKVDPLLKSLWLSVKCLVGAVFLPETRLFFQAYVADLTSHECNTKALPLSSCCNAYLWQSQFPAICPMGFRFLEEGSFLPQEEL